MRMPLGLSATLAALIATTREGAIWHTPRSSLRAAVGVLYPDAAKITTLAPRS